MNPRPLAVITGASSGIGRELATECAKHGFDLVIAADDPAVDDVADELRDAGVRVDAVVSDLGTRDGIDRLYHLVNGRPVDALLANAGHGLGRAFLDQDFDEVRHMIATNITGTMYLIQKVGRDMRRRGQGRILITGSIAGYLPGTYTAVYNGTKAFIDSFTFALRAELKTSGVTVTSLLPGVSDTAVIDRADMIARLAEENDDPIDVAKAGFDAMIRGDSDVVAVLKDPLAPMNGISPTRSFQRTAAHRVRRRNRQPRTQ